MKLTVTRSLLALTVLALLSGPTRAQDESGGSSRVSDSSESLPPTADTVFVAPGPQSGPYFQTTPVETWFAPRTYFDARGGVLYGYEESFTSVGAFLPHFFEENAMVFADARGLASYDGRGGANLGLGWRYYMPGYDRFVGLSAWYDFDAGHIRSYNQMGLSFESVGRYMDLRMNGYIPVGNDQNVLATTLAGPGRFNGNSLFLSRFNEIETAFTGFDTEIGGPMPLLGRYGLSGYAGFYFFTGSSGSDFTGVSGRLNLQVNEDWSIGVQSTDDHVFGTNAQIQVVMNLPDGKAGRWLRPLSVRDRMMQSVFRNYRVTVEHEIQVTDELALNPKDNQPYFVVHVDPNGEDGAATGDGSFSNPYNQLAQFDTLPFAEKSQVDIIYVDPRTDGTSINLDDGVTLLSCQRLLSSSLSHSFGIAQFPGVLFDVPNAMLGQPLPVLENNTGGNVVTFADGAFMVQVSGFEINGSATGSGIVGTNNRSVAIDRNVIQNGVNGISLFNLSGLAANSEASFIDRNIIRFNQQDGVNISNSGAGPLDLFITRNHPTDIDLDQLDQVDADGDDVADLKSPDSLDGDGDFSNDGILGNGDDGIDLNADAGSVINVLFQENRIGGQVVNPADGTLTNAGNGDNGIEMDATAASRITAAILDHTPVPVTAPFDDGQGNLTDVTLFTADYRIGFNGNNGIAVTTANSEIDLLNTGGIRNNLINGNGRDTTVGGVGSGTGDDGDGIDIVSTANSTVTLGVFGNSIGAPSATDTSGNDITDPTLGNAGIGLRFSADSGSSLLAIGAADIPATPTTPAVINGNDFSFNAVSGIDIAASGSALVSFNIENNRIRNVVTDPTPPPLAALTFTLDGSSATNPFIITNLSDPGIDIVSVLWNLAPTSVSFDTNNVALNNLAAFQPFAPPAGGNQSDVTTGLTQVNATVIVPGTNPLNDVFGTLVDATDIPDSSTLLSLNFNDFDPTEQFLARIREAQNPQQANRQDAAATGAATAGSIVTATFSNNLQVTFNLALNGPTGVSGTGQIFGAPSAGSGSGQDGIHVAASGNATINPAVIQNNNVQGYAAHGIHVEATDLANIPNLVIRDNVLMRNGDGGDPTIPRLPSGVALEIEKSGSATVNAFVDNNLINANFNDGFQMTSTGTIVGGLFVNSEDNQITANGGDGVVIFAAGSSRLTWDSTRDVIVGNQGDNINGLITENAIVTINLDNTTVNNAGDDGFDLTLDGTAVLTINIGSPNDPLFMGLQSTFSGNGGDGFRLTTRGRSLALVDIDDTLFNDNGGDGLSFAREDTSLILASLTNSSASSNDDDGIQFYAGGSNRADPNTPLFNAGTLLAPASRLVINNVVADNNGVSTSPNGGNGLETATFDDAVLVITATTSSFSNNFMDGVRSFSTGQSSFGELADRVTFDNVNINDNGRDGIKLFSMGTFSNQPNMFVEVNSETGVTNISSNGDDGIQASMPFGGVDLLVTGETGPVFTTLIQQNGFGAGITPSLDGHGIEFNVADAAIDGDDASDVAGSNVRVDGDLGGGANEILDFFLPNGFEFDGTANGFSGIGVLTVQFVAIGDDNLSDTFDFGNAGDGIHVFNSNLENFHGTGGNGAGSQFNNPNAGNERDVNRDLIADTAAGRGGTASAATFDLLSQAGFVTVNIDNTQLAGNGRDGLHILSDGDNQVFDTGNIVNATVTNSLISENGRHGVNVDLEGRHGEHNAFDAIFSGGLISYQVLTANSLVFDGNVIERNNNYGFRYQQNAGPQRRIDFGNIPDTYFWSEQFQDGIQPTNPPFSFDPVIVAANTILAPIWNTENIGDGFALNDRFYSIATDSNSRVTFNNNIVQFNGQPSQNFDFGPNGGGDGMFFRVSTDSYLSLDMGGQAGSGNGNVFTGNAVADIRFESFTATEVDGITPMVPNVTTAAAAPTPDRLYLDDTAQLTLRFNNNIGREVDANFIIVGAGATVGQRAAAYNVNGSPFIGGTNRLRLTQMFQVDDGFNLNANNQFNTDLTTEFSFSGGWHLVPIADPAFPNPDFPESVLEDFGHPWFP